MKSARNPVHKNQPVVGFDLLNFSRTMAMRGLLVAALGAAGASTAEALDITWVGGYPLSPTSWDLEANWSGGQPTPADTAIFGGSGSSSTVDLGAAGGTVSGLTFKNTVGTTINSASQTLTLGTPFNDCFVNVVGSSHTINAAVAGTGDIRLHGAGNLTFGNTVTAAAIAIGSLEDLFNPSYSGTVTFKGTVTTEGLTVGDSTYNSLSPCTLLLGGTGNITNSFAPAIFASGITVRAETASSTYSVVGGDQGIYIGSVAFDGPGNLLISDAYIDNLEGTAPTQMTYTLNGTGKVRFAGLDEFQAGMGLIKAGAGVMEILGTGLYTGTTSITDGTLALADVGALQNSTLETGGGGAVTFTVAGNQTYQLGGLKGSGLLDAGANSLRVGSNGESTVSTGGITAAALTKEGAGTLTLTGPQTYATLTTDAGAGATIVNTAIGTGTTAVVANGNIRFGAVSQTLASLTIGAGASVTFTSGPASFADNGADGKSASFGGAAAVPEPGALGLLLVGALGLLAARRRHPVAG